VEHQTVRAGSPQPSCQSQLDELLEDPSFLKLVELIAKEVMRFWSVPHKAARGFVLSAIGEPETLASLYDTWIQAKQTGELGLAKVILRRRVIDLLRKDARPGHHCSLPATADAAEPERCAGTFDELVQRSPRTQLELQQVIHMVRRALACFAAQGQVQQRQAQLLHRYALDDADYAELAVELASSEGALRVRVHKAMLAFRRHIQVCHPELEELLERDRRPPRSATRSRTSPACSTARSS
jgi:DNA-directed RNA polymerase specialized sigma24 family protein